MTLTQFIILLGSVYIILSLGLYFMLRKAQYKRAWFALLPVGNVYKMFSMNYDFFKGDQLISKSVDQKTYQDNRRYASLFIMLTYFITVVGITVLEETINPTDLTIEREPASNPVEFLFTGVGDVFTFLAIGVVMFFMFRMFVNKSTGEPMNAVIIGVFILASAFSYGLTSVLLMYYFGLSPKYEYDLREENT